MKGSTQMITCTGWSHAGLTVLENHTAVWNNTHNPTFLLWTQTRVLNLVKGEIDLFICICQVAA